MRTFKTKPKLNAKTYRQLRYFTHHARDLRNHAIKLIEDEYSKNGKSLNYYGLYHLIKNHPSYKSIQSNMSQMILRNVSQDYTSFFKLIKLKQSGQYDKPVNKPSVQEKNRFSVLYINPSYVKINDERYFKLPAPRGYYKEHDDIMIHVPECVDIDKLRQVQIIPKFNARFFQVHFITDDVESQELKPMKHALGIDLGVSNFATCVSTRGDSFIMDGKWLKSATRYYQKEMAFIRRMKKKQNHTHITKRELRIRQGYSNRTHDFIYKTAKYIIDYCLEHKLDTVIIGYNKGFKQKVNIGRKNNQLFVSQQFGKLRERLELLCKRSGLNYVEQEESYTSKSSFFDNDPLPEYNPERKEKIEHRFSGKRTHRGLYKTKNGDLVNADLNGALNIIRKSKLMDDKVKVLQSRSRVSRPLRISVL